MPSDQDILISIITPTYNRAHTLHALYVNLLTQRFKKFEWILVDDGSVDHTEQLAAKWLEECKIPIRYYKIENGGKTKAVYHGFSQDVGGKYTFVLDSDDYLHSEALQVINNHLSTLSDNYIGIVGLKPYSNGKVVGSRFVKSEGSYIDIYYGRNASQGDKLFILKTEIYKQSIVLPFGSEKYMPDNVPYIMANRLGCYKLINEVLYVGDYLPEGMTLNTKKMLLDNIESHVFEKRELQKEKLSFRYKIFNTIYYIYFCLLAKRNLKDILSDSGDKVLTLFLFIPTFCFLQGTNKLR